MYENVIAWAVLGLLFVLCLPLARVQRALLALYGLGLRLGMLALVGAAAYLWFRPADLPTDVADTVGRTPLLAGMLPEPGTPLFAICAVSWIALVLLPLIAIIDICRRAVCRRVSVSAAEPVTIQAAPVVSGGRPVPPPYAQEQPPSRFGRRDAATVLSQAGSSR